MARLTPVSQRQFVERLRELGFEGPYAGGRHPKCAAATSPLSSRIHTKVTLVWAFCADCLTGRRLARMAGREQLIFAGTGSKVDPGKPTPYTGVSGPRRRDQPAIVRDGKP